MERRLLVGPAWWQLAVSLLGLVRVIGLTLVGGWLNTLLGPEGSAVGAGALACLSGGGLVPGLGLLVPLFVRASPVWRGEGVGGVVV